MKIHNIDHRPSQAIIDLGAIRYNVMKIIEGLDPYQELYVAVKANGYGHGAVPVAKAAIEAGATGLLVATVDEGIALRLAGLKYIPILVMGLTDPRGIAEILYYDLMITVSSLEFFHHAYQQLVETEKLFLIDPEKNHNNDMSESIDWPISSLKFHLALDTGMGRIGLRNLHEVQEFTQGIEAYPWVKWIGVFTHFATAAGGPEAYIETQMASWKELLQAIPDYVQSRHFANSGMSLWYSEVEKSDIVRAGITVYGLDPKDNYSQALDLGFQPALSLISELTYVKRVKAGSFISYGATYQAETDEWIGTVPMGYADGWLRAYAGSDLIVNGYPCPVVGVINMDQLMIRLPMEFPIGTTVTLIGRDGNLVNRPEDIAREAQTIGYEIVTCLSQRIPRVYLNE